MSIKVLVFGMTDNPGGMESCVMNYYRNIDWSDVQFDFLCNWENMVYADEVTAKGSKIYTIPQKSKDYKAYKKALDDFFKAHKGEYDVFWYNTCTLTNIDYLVYAKKYGIKKRIIHAHNSGNETSKLRGIFHYLNKTRLSQYATDYWSCSMVASEYFYNGCRLFQSYNFSSLALLHHTYLTGWKLPHMTIYYPLYCLTSSFL